MKDASHYTRGSSFPRVKRQGGGVKHPPPFSAEVKERAEPLPLWAFAVCYRVTFTFTLVVLQQEPDLVVTIELNLENLCQKKEQE